MPAHASGDLLTEPVAGDVLRHLLQTLGHGEHGMAPVGVNEAVAVRGFAGRAVDDGDEVVSDDDAVLAFPVWAFGNDCLLDDLHESYSSYLSYLSHSSY